MSKKGKERKPSLGMASKGRDKKKGSRGRDTGKPYARTGGTGKLLARRKAEEEEIEFNLSVVKEEEEMENIIDDFSTSNLDDHVRTLSFSSV